MNPIPKLFVGYAVIVFIAFLPIIISIVGGLIGRLMGENWHEGNSAVMAFFWGAMFTIPSGIIALIIWTIYWVVKIRS